jgi:hypothetical protein
MQDINQIIEAAKALGIKLTNAELGTELCECWIDRVLNAQVAFERDDMTTCQEMIDSANAYAI